MYPDAPVPASPDRAILLSLVTTNRRIKMPSSPNYKRDYKQERKTDIANGGLEDDRVRKKARRSLERKGMVKPFDGKDVDHKVPISKGGGNSASNLRVKDASANRSYPRTSRGAVKKP